MDLGMKRGEFAKFCNTTKETLRHYEKLELLSPITFSETGYGIYSPLQALDFYLITALRDAGCSLKEIKQYLANPADAQMHLLLQERIAAIEIQREKLLQQKNLLEKSLERTFALDKWEKGRRYRIVDMPKRRYIQTPCSFEPGEEESIMTAVADHVSYCESLHLGESLLQQTYRVGKEAFLKGEYSKDFFCCAHVADDLEDERIHIRPAGTYLVLLRRVNLADALASVEEDLLSLTDLDSVSSLESLRWSEVLANRLDEKANLELQFQSCVGGRNLDSAETNESDLFFEGYDQAKQLVSTLGYKIIGDVYETELSLYSGNLKEEIFSEIEIPIAKK